MSRVRSCAARLGLVSALRCWRLAADVCVGGDAGAAEDAASDALIDAEAAVDATPDARCTPRASGSRDTRRRLPNALVTQGGTDRMLRTDERGELTIQLDRVVRLQVVIASHPDARIEGVLAYATSDEPLIIELLRFDASDNETTFFNIRNSGSAGGYELLRALSHHDRDEGLSASHCGVQPGIA